MIRAFLVQSRVKIREDRRSKNDPIGYPLITKISFNTCAPVGSRSLTYGLRGDPASGSRREMMYTVKHEAFLSRWNTVTHVSCVRLQSNPTGKDSVFEEHKVGRKSIIYVSLPLFLSYRPLFRTIASNPAQIFHRLVGPYMKSALRNIQFEC